MNCLTCLNHVAFNGEIIGRSEKYTAAQSRDYGI
jgi:uncharacterized protein YegP (UPF0339 family)